MMPGVCRVGSVEAEGISMIDSDLDSGTRRLGKRVSCLDPRHVVPPVVNQSAIFALRRHCTKINPPPSCAVITLPRNKNALARRLGRAS
jgi:hypothetical protein